MPPSYDGKPAPYFAYFGDNAGPPATMTLTEFNATLEKDVPPSARPALVALWHEAKGNWTRAHEVAQDIDDATGSWVHAYLHRKEGDEGNAAYWYRKAGRPVERGPLDAEWTRMVTALLSD